jgi:hypothetical protein
VAPRRTMPRRRIGSESCERRNRSQGVAVHQTRGVKAKPVDHGVSSSVAPRARGWVGTTGPSLVDITVPSWGRRLRRYRPQPRGRSCTSVLRDNCACTRGRAASISPGPGPGPRRPPPLIPWPPVLSCNGLRRCFVRPQAGYGPVAAGWNRINLITVLRLFGCGLSSDFGRT